MAYIYVEEESLEEGQELADVVERSEYDAVLTERDELISQRDTLIERAEVAERGWEDARNKYADAFITSASRVKDDQREDVTDDGQVQTFEELWGARGKFGAY